MLPPPAALPADVGTASFPVGVVAGAPARQARARHAVTMKRVAPRTPARSTRHFSWLRTSGLDVVRRPHVLARCTPAGYWRGAPRRRSPRRFRARAPLPAARALDARRRRGFPLAVLILAHPRAGLGG